MDYLQDASTFQCQDAGHGLEYMAENDFSWLLAAWQIEVIDLPRFADSIKVSTWCYGTHGLYAYRNFLLASPDGHDYVRADSIWFVLDTTCGRPKRIPEAESAIYLTGEARLDMPETKRKLSVEGEGTPTRPVMVNEQHLDTNNHVNNAQYVEMARGALAELDYSSELEGLRLRIQYRKAAVLGDLIVPHVHVEEDAIAVDLAAQDGTSYAVVRTSRL
jgi:acyl-ACP thioesterase